MIYLDNNATTRMAPEVLDAMLPFFDEFYGNPSSPHHFGGQVEKHLFIARQQIANLIGCHPKEIFFTSGGTESDNLAIRGILAANPEKNHIITSRVEHSAVLVQCQELERLGYQVDYLPVDANGLVDPDDVLKSINDRTAIVSIIHANNETGVISPIAAIGEICRHHLIPFHSDAVQSFGKVPLNVRDCRVDLLSLSAHKIHGPKGIGALYVRAGVRIRPILWGGHQEYGKRPGTEPVPLIVGFGKAAELAGEQLSLMDGQVRRLRDSLQQGLLQTIPNLRINGAQADRLPNTLNVCFCGVEGEALLLLLDQHGIAASSGSACLADKLEPSHVLLAMGVPESDAMGAVRFSLSRFSNEADIEETLRLLPGFNQQLRDMTLRLEI